MGKPWNKSVLIIGGKLFNPEVMVQITNEKGEKVTVDAGRLAEKTVLSDGMNQKLQDFILGTGETPMKSVRTGIKIKTSHP
jgi:hypothetical protein